MRRRWLRSGALACLAAALLLHRGFTEWRTLEVPAADEARAAERLLLPIRTRRHPLGNAERWDREDRALRAYDAAWRACYREACGEPEPDGPLARCLAARPYRIGSTTAEAVALAECERALHGAIPDAAAIAACLRVQGYPEAPVPRWSFERIGHRYDGPYVTLTGVFAEARLADPRASRWLGAALGLAFPALLVALAIGALRRAA